MELCTTLQEERDPESFSTFKERLRYLQVSVSSVEVSIVLSVLV